jgi:curved DNA-binding protein CbpA
MKQRHPNLYAILELEDSAGPDEIRSAYRRLAKRHHPDRNPQVGSMERMQAINQAYAVLRDPIQRAQYDQYLAMLRHISRRAHPPHSTHQHPPPHGTCNPYPPPRRTYQHPPSSPPKRPRRRAPFSGDRSVRTGGQSWLWPLILIAAFRACSLTGSLLDSRVPSIPTPDPSITAQAAFQSASHWPLAAFDGFEASNPNHWQIGSFENDRAAVRSRLQGTFLWQAWAEMHFVVWGHPQRNSIWETPATFFLSVDCRKISGPELAVMGLVFRGSGSEMYVFRLRGDQHFAISYLDESSKDWISLLPWTRNSSVHPGEVNRLAVIGEDAHFLFFINGHYVGELDDRRLASGTAGLAIELFHSGDQAQFEFDNLELQIPLDTDHNAIYKQAPFFVSLFPHGSLVAWHQCQVILSAGFRASHRSQC